VLREHPELLIVLRGVDVAATELSVPTWAMGLLLLDVRQASVEAAGRLARLAPLWRVPPIRLTGHVGEEYRSLSEGLRHIHELVEMGIVTVGDRLGHALALGESPEAWAKRWRHARQPREDRLDDLLWEFDRATTGEVDIGSARREPLRAEVRRLAADIYGETLEVEVLVEARRLRHSATLLRQLGFPFLNRRAPLESSDKAVLLWYRYLTDASVFLRGRVPVVVPVTPAEIGYLTEAQKWLARSLSEREVTIESNPSSNLLVGDFGTFANHPSLKIHPLPRDRDHGRAYPPLSINSDDPLCFATSLADEYSYVYAALLGIGVGSTDALAWIDERRRDGYRSRFTLPISTDPAVLEYLQSPARVRNGLVGSNRGGAS